jgi:hypothetical protein
VKLFVGLSVFLHLVTFIGCAIYLIEGDYPRVHQQSRGMDIGYCFLAAAFAYWGLTLLSP